MPYVPIRGGNEFEDRIQDRLVQAFAELEARIVPPTRLVSFVVSGRNAVLNGVGPVPLPPVKDPSKAIIRRAAIGMRLVAAVDLTSVPPVDVQTAFEQAITVSDQIQQRSTQNLAPKKLLIMVST